jgi:hypothetical protein
MPPLRFYADESVLGVGKALATARRDLVHPGHPLVPELPLGVLDPDWIPVVASKGLVVILRDRHIRTKPVERDLLRRHGLRAFWLAGKRDMDTWHQLELLVRKWDLLEETITKRGSGPWFYALSESRLTEIPV